MPSSQQIAELFHLLFLSHLGQKVNPAFYCLKGGCNLRFFFKSIRYSQDLDLDVKTISVSTLRKNVDKILSHSSLVQNLRTRNIHIDHLSSPKQTETTQRWKIHLRVAGQTLPIPTRIEFSRRSVGKHCVLEPMDPEILQHYNLYPVLCNHYTKEEAARQKLEALIGRREIQARDIFDLKLLLDQGASLKMPSKTKLDFQNLKNLVQSVSDAVYQSQVVNYLRPEYQEYYGSKGRWAEIQRAVLHKVEGEMP